MTSPAQTAPAPAPRQPNTLRTVLLVVGSIVLAIILITTVVRVAYSLNREDTSGTFSVEEQFDQVDVRVSAANVDVEFADIDEPRITFEQGGTNLRLDREVSGGVLTITVDHPGWGWFGWGCSAMFGTPLADGRTAPRAGSRTPRAAWSEGRKPYPIRTHRAFRPEKRGEDAAAGSRRYRYRRKTSCLTPDGPRTRRGPGAVTAETR